ncbi:SGNH/GDSL hydrolase family protein [Luteolibacter sp. Populi]|uniref:SGNH/GDSL hydrolase family protein n=1 Tax=Luteolibacter sp. Populi TaxID=3230487 RepID=UPI0034666599
MAAAGAGATALRQFIVVAEGDSWFDYKPAFLGGGKDLLGHLQSSGRINVFRVSKAGDTMENMIYGTATSGKGTGMQPDLPPQLDQTLKAIRDKNADAFFFSGGGNDLAGVELASYLNHQVWGSPTIRRETLDFIFGTYFAKALKDLINTVREVKPGIPIFIHGYDYAVPDGRDVSFLGFNFSGPWLKPALVQKRRTDPAEGREIMVKVLDTFNAVLKKVAAAHPDVHYIDLRKTLRNGANYKDDWANELHPTSSGFQQLARKIETVMLQNLP